MATNLPGERNLATAVPPGFLLRGAGEHFTGSELLDDFGEDEAALAVVLLHTLRSVLVWLETEASERATAFRPGAAEARRRQLRAISGQLDRRTAGALRVLGSVLRRGADPQLGRLGEAAALVATWADSQGKVATALGFMQLAALARPADARYAYHTGRLARRRAEYARAEAWFVRAIQLSRSARDRDSYGRALSGFGNLFLQRGNLPAARHYHLRALQAARKYGLRDLEGGAAHDLFVLAKRAEHAAEAEAMAATAMLAYGPDHPRLPNLAHDIAHWWLDQGRFVEALQVFDAVLPHLAAIHERWLTLGNIARAAGAVGDREAFDAAWAELHAGITGCRSQQGLAAALAATAAGARSLGQYDLAGTLAAEAMEVARRREEHRERFLAEAVLTSLHPQPGSAPPLEAPPTDRRASSELAADLKASLGRRKPAAV